MRITIGCPRCKGAIRMKGEIVIQRRKDAQPPDGHTFTTANCARCGWSGQKLLYLQCHPLA